MIFLDIRLLQLYTRHTMTTIQMTTMTTQNQDAPTTTVMSYEEFQTSLQTKVGSLCFPNEIYDATYFCDKTKIRKLIKDQLPEKAKIYGIFVHTTASPLFKPVANKGIPYKMEVATFANSDGAFRSTFGWVSKMPLGDAIVVFKVPKTKAQ